MMLISNSDVSLWKSKYEWNWYNKCMTYLGIGIHRQLENIFSLNYLPVIDQTRQNLRRIGQVPTSLKGRVNIIVMFILPKYLCAFQNLPMIPPQSHSKGS